MQTKTFNLSVSYGSVISFSGSVSVVFLAKNRGISFSR